MEAPDHFRPVVDTATPRGDVRSHIETITRWNPFLSPLPRARPDPSGLVMYGRRASVGTPHVAVVGDACPRPSRARTLSPCTAISVPSRRMRWRLAARWPSSCHCSGGLGGSAGVLCWRVSLGGSPGPRRPRVPPVVPSPVGLVQEVPVVVRLPLAGQFGGRDRQVERAGEAARLSPSRRRPPRRGTPPYRAHTLTHAAAVGLRRRTPPRAR